MLLTESPRSLPWPYGVRNGKGRDPIAAARPAPRIRVIPAEMIWFGDGWRTLRVPAVGAAIVVITGALVDRSELHTDDAHELGVVVPLLRKKSGQILLAFLLVVVFCLRVVKGHELFEGEVASILGAERGDVGLGDVEPFMGPAPMMDRLAEAKRKRMAGALFDRFTTAGACRHRLSGLPRLGDDVEVVLVEIRARVEATILDEIPA